jgi:hypothetical protein
MDNMTIEEKKAYWTQFYSKRARDDAIYDELLQADDSWKTNGSVDLMAEFERRVKLADEAEAKKA